MTIRVHIERLILDGLDIGPSGAIHLQEALQSRLTQLLTEQGIPGDRYKTTWVPALATQRMSITRGAEGTRLGARAAESLHTALASQSDSPAIPHGSVHE